MPYSKESRNGLRFNLVSRTRVPAFLLAGRNASSGNEIGYIFFVTNFHPMRLRAWFNICFECKMADGNWDKFVATVLCVSLAAHLLPLFMKAKLELVSFESRMNNACTNLAWPVFSISPRVHISKCEWSYKHVTKQTLKACADAVIYASKTGNGRISLVVYVQFVISTIHIP